jgi:hypothetical protein
MLHTALAVAAALIGLAFSLSTFERWQLRRRRHEAAWSVSLAMFALAAAALAAGEALGWTSASFRLFFFFGAIANVPFLALGTIYLLAGRRPGDWWAAGIALATAFAAGVVLMAPFTAPLPRHELASAKEVFGVLPRVLAAVASGGGAAIVFGGAAWSAVRSRSGQHRLANVLIALGTLVLANSGLLNSVFDEITGFVVTLVLGISVLFAGFLVATSGASPRTSPTPGGVLGEETGAYAPVSSPNS